MSFLNVGCGAVRPGSPWINLDDLHSQLLPGTPERKDLDRQENYVNFVIGSGPLPFPESSFLGVVASHVVEHFDAIEGLALVRECYRVLKPGGQLIVSVPNCSYFKTVIDADTIENAELLFGEPIHLPDGHDNFFDYALWMRQHKAILNYDSLWCYLKKAGFKKENILDYHARMDPYLLSILNRKQFSVIIGGIK